MERGRFTRGGAGRIEADDVSAGGLQTAIREVHALARERPEFLQGPGTPVPKAEVRGRVGTDDGSVAPPSPSAIQVTLEELEESATSGQPAPPGAVKIDDWLVLATTTVHSDDILTTPASFVLEVPLAEGFSKEVRLWASVMDLSWPYAGGLTSTFTITGGQTTEMDVAMILRDADSL
jgi:hypothetical protein